MLEPPTQGSGPSLVPRTLPILGLGISSSPNKFNGVGGGGGTGLGMGLDAGVDIAKNWGLASFRLVQITKGLMNFELVPKEEEKMV